MEEKQITKAEMQETIKELTLKVEEQKHLASAIEAKDGEIFKLDKEVKELKRQLQEHKHLASAVEAKDLELVKLKSEVDKYKQKSAEDVSNTKKSFDEKIINKDLEIDSLKKELEKIPALEKLQEAIEGLSKENKILVKVANGHLNAFRNLMKSIQGTLDNAIELEAVITESLQIQKGGNK